MCSNSSCFGDKCVDHFDNGRRKHGVLCQYPEMFLHLLTSLSSVHRNKFHFGANRSQSSQQRILKEKTDKL